MPDHGRHFSGKQLAHPSGGTARAYSSVPAAASGLQGAGFGEAAGQAIAGSYLQPTAQPRRIKILITEDDAQMRVMLRGCFEHAGFIVAEAANADELWAAMARERFDLVTLDVRLPGAGGLELVQSIRARGDVPVVMISVITNLIDRVTALERGADDFIVKPFDLMDLLARVRAVVRRYDARPAAGVPAVARRRYSFDGWLFDAGRRELRSVSGDIKNLTDQELSLLELFVQHPQQELSRESIIQHLHGVTASASLPAANGQPDAAGTDGDAQSSRLRVDMQVSRLRKKLESPGSAGNVIKSVRGVGYIFSAAVDGSG